MRAALFLGLMLGVAAPALAQQGEQTPPPRACYVTDTELPAGLEDWKGKAALASGTSDADIAKAAITLGKGYEAALLNTPKVSFSVQPEKPGGSVAHAGLFTFTVETAGAYTVALSTPAWIDVLENGKAIEPTSFGHGPECTTIRKMVVFPLQPGSHVLQVSGNAAPTMKLMVAKKP